MSFFVTSRGLGDGANLGGLAGADAHCASLAEAAGVTGKSWAAYLSTDDANARDRIGAGPWVNAKGEIDPPPLNGSTLKYGFDHEGGPQWQTSDTSPTRSSRSFGRLRFC